MEKVLLLPSGGIRYYFDTIERSDVTEILTCFRDSSPQLFVTFFNHAFLSDEVM